MLKFKKNSRYLKNKQRKNIRISALIFLASTFLSLSLSSCGSTDQIDQLKEENEVLKEQLSSLNKESEVSEENTNSNIEVETIENEQIESVVVKQQEEKKYIASDLWVIEVDEHCCLLMDNGGLSDSIINAISNYYGTNIDDYKYEDCNYNYNSFHWVSIFKNANGNPCCYFNRRYENMKMKNSNTSIEISTFNFRYSIDDSLSYTMNYETWHQTIENEFGELEDNYKDYNYSFKYDGSKPDFSWDEEISLVRFTEVFGCNPDDTFTLDELSEMLQELSVKKGLTLHKK